MTKKMSPSKLLAAYILSAGLLQAAPGNRNGNDFPPPPVPYVEALGCITPGSTMEITVLGLVVTNEEFVEKKGNAFISGSFNNPGLTINSITVNTASALRVNFTAAADATLGTSTLTITNPDGQSATSTSAVACVTDVPQISTTELTPTPPSVIDNLEARVTELINAETSFSVTYQYQWYENGVAIDQTDAILPASATVQNRSYFCEITPIKNSFIFGPTASTQTVTVKADADGNGIHDAWENSVLSGLGSDPNADADGDGLTTRQEYLFGLDPNDASSRRPIVSGLNPNTGEFQYSRPVEKIEGITYTVEASTDLVNWAQDTGATQSLNSANANSEVITVGVSPSLISNNSRLFVRISVN